MERQYTLNQVAEITSFAPSTLYRWLREGRLHGIKIGTVWRIPKTEVDRILAGETYV